MIQQICIRIFQGLLIFAYLAAGFCYVNIEDPMISRAVLVFVLVPFTYVVFTELKALEKQYKDNAANGKIKLYFSTVCGFCRMEYSRTRRVYPGLPKFVFRWLQKDNMKQSFKAHYANLCSCGDAPVEKLTKVEAKIDKISPEDAFSAIPQTKVVCNN